MSEAESEIIKLLQEILAELKSLKECCESTKGELEQINDRQKP